MAWNGLLAELQPPVDCDYVSHFQKLADLNLEIKQMGPTYMLMLRKCMLECALGSYAAARRSALDAALMRDEGEAQYHVAISSILLSYARAGALTSIPGEIEDEEPETRVLLEEAQAALEQAAASLVEDSESTRLAHLVGQVLDRSSDEDSLLANLAAQAEVPMRRRRARPLRGHGPN